MRMTVNWVSLLVLVSSTAYSQPQSLFPKSINLIFKKDLSLMVKLRKRSEIMYIYKTLLLTFTNICHGRVIDVKTGF